jgi:isopenicillin-N N-acyltransferase-like protein
MLQRYREIEVAGSWQVMGQQIGEAAREEICGFVETSYETLQKNLRISRAKIKEIVRGSTSFVEKYSPELLLELQGMADSTGLLPDDLMFLQIRNQLTPDMDSGCTSFSCGATETRPGNGIIGQNWDNDPSLDPFTVVLTRRPLDRPAFISITQAGLIAYIGFSDCGISACLNSLPAPSRPVGVPHYFTLRRIFESRDLDGAVHAVASAERAIPANIMMLTPQGPANLEVTLDIVQVLRPETDEILLHTNHCLHPDLVKINQQFDELIQSGPRLRRFGILTGESQQSLDVAKLKACLSDHDGFPQSICRHANNSGAHGNWATVFSVIMEPNAGVMQICRGNPCESAYETYRLT